jgi:phage virion morphogenesis protein
MVVSASLDTSRLRANLTGKRIRDFRQPMRAVGNILLSETQANFHAERSPNGGGWAALSPVTIERKGHGKKLWETGAMFSAIGVSVSENSAEIYCSDWKARFHQYGTRKMPARPFIGVSSSMLNRAVGVVAAYAKGR